MNDRNSLSLSRDEREYIRKHANDDPAKLRLATHKKTDRDYPFLIAQIEARKKLKGKLPEWLRNPEILFPEKTPLEQASSEIAAKYKASIFKGKNMADLTGGLGVDCYYFSKNFDNAHYCERNETLVDLARYNFGVLGAENIEVQQGDGISFLKDTGERFDFIYLDPARRGDENQKVFLPQDCEPDFTKHLDLLLKKSKQVLVKLSPFADISLLANLPPGPSKIWVLSLSGDVKELLLQWDAIPAMGTATLHLAHCQKSTQIWTQDEFPLEAPLPEKIAAQSGRYLFEPFPAWMKAINLIGFGARYGLEKLALHTHIYTANHLPDMKTLPAHGYEVQLSMSYSKKMKLPKQANVKCRNFPIPADEFYKRHKIKPGGQTFVIAAGMEKGPIVFVCKAITPAQ